MLTWAPLWFFRREAHVFDSYVLGGITGAILGFIYWLGLSHYNEHFRETLNVEIPTKITYCLATITGSGIMFLFGCYFRLKES